MDELDEYIGPDKVDYIYKGLLKSDLQALCRARKVSPTGTKSVLIQRLKESDKQVVA
jgi:hypothetical protein